MFHHDKAGAPRFDASLADTDTFEIGAKWYSVREAIKKGWYTRDSAGKLIRTTDGATAGAPTTTL